MKNDVQLMVDWIKMARNKAMQLSVTGEINVNTALQIEASAMYDLLDEALIRAIKLKRLADEA